MSILSVRVLAKRPRSHLSSCALRYLSTNSNNDRKDDEKKPADAPVLTFVERLPPKWQPYAYLARLDKPVGTWLLLWPGYWSLALSSGAMDMQLLTQFGVGAVLLRGAGCTINDMWDKDIDARVERTRQRPLASGQLTMNQAWIFLAGQLSMGLGILLSLPWDCFAWGVAAIPLIGIYPATKRYFIMPQLVLGCAMNWGVWMAAAATGMDYYSVLPLYTAGITWTLVYDTIYAHQDQKEDKQLGLQSSAHHLGRPALHALAFMTYAQWLMVGDVWLPGITLAYGHLFWQVQTADFENPHNLMQRFKGNATVGGLVFGSIVIGSL